MVIAEIFEWCKDHVGLFIGVSIGATLMVLATAPLDEPQYKYDLNNDGVVDIKDMLIVQEYILDNERCECNEINR